MPSLTSGNSDTGASKVSSSCTEAIRQYLGQVATYPRIGFLVVLDLVSQRGWPLTLEDNCWVDGAELARQRPAYGLRLADPRWTAGASKVTTPVH